jgi:hypothetical protein
MTGAQKTAELPTLAPNLANNWANDWQMLARFRLNFVKMSNYYGAVQKLESKLRIFFLFFLLRKS